MRITSLFVGFFVFTFTFALSAQSTIPTCGHILANAEISVSQSDSYRRIIELSKLSPDLSGSDSRSNSLRRLAYALLNSNARPLLEIRSELIRKTNEAVKQLTGNTMFAPMSLNDVKADVESGKLQVEIREVHILKSSNFHIYEAQFVSHGASRFSFQFRSNGTVAYLNNTYDYRTAVLTDYTGAYFEAGQIKTFSIGRLILSTLENDVQLSRSMSENERRTWLAGDLARLGSPTYNGKIHFAFKYCYFKCAPYIVRVPKSLLVELFEMPNFLEVYQAIS